MNQAARRIPARVTLLHIPGRRPGAGETFAGARDFAEANALQVRQGRAQERGGDESRTYRRVVALRDGAPKKVANQQGGSLPRNGKVVITGIITYDSHGTSNNIFFEKGADSMKPTEVKTERPPREPNAFTRRIGSTTYTVGVHFSDTSKDTVNDKIVRLVRREAEEKAGAV